MGLFPQKLTKNRKRVPVAIQLTFLDRLARSLANGYSLLAALETLKWDRKLEPIAGETIRQLKEGNKLDQVMDNLSFHSLVTTYLYFSREHGDLETSIKHCLNLLQRRLEYRKKFAQSIRYPIILTVIFSITFFFIQHRVLPNLLTLFQNGMEDNFLLITMISIFSKLYIIVLIAGGLIGTSILVWQALKKKLATALQIKVYKLIPIYRSYLTLYTSFLFSTHVGSLLNTGLSIKEVLEIIAKQPKLNILSYYASELTISLQHGQHLDRTMDKLTFINPQLSSIFQKNTNQQELANDLTTFSTFLTEEMNQKIIKIITYIQPIFFILLGVIIIFVYLSIMLPMYQFLETI